MNGRPIPLGPDVRLLTSHPAGIRVVDKPAGIRSHPNTRKPDPKALLTVPYDAANECYIDGDRRWFLLHRLDAPTSGLLLLADNPALSQELKRLFATREIEKVYAAIVRGRPLRRSELWSDRLRTERAGAAVRARQGGGGGLAVTAMKTLRTSPGAPLRSLLELQPKSGRTHQLRIQCASRNLPIIGDATYGDFRFNREFARTVGTNRLFLHAHRLVFRLSWNGQEIRMRAESPLPVAFATAPAG